MSKKRNEAMKKTSLILLFTLLAAFAFAGGTNEITFQIPGSSKHLVWGDDLKLVDPQEGVEKTFTTETSIPSDSITGIKSNVVFHDGKIYLADSKDLYCFDNDLNVLWFAQLPTSKTSEMIIKIDGDSLTLKSTGLAYRGSSKIRCGKPFIACYDANSGRQYFLRYIDILAKP